MNAKAREVEEKGEMNREPRQALVACLGWMQKQERWRDRWRAQMSTCSSSGINVKAREVKEKGKMNGEPKRALVAHLG
jgi:hypothetical protein